MTIGAALKRRLRLLLLALFGCCLAITLCIHFYAAVKPDVAGMSWPVLVCFSVFGAVAYLLARIRCPACRESLYGTLDDIGLRRGEMTRCPYCRADFSSPA